MIKKILLILTVILLFLLALWLRVFDIRSSYSLRGPDSGYLDMLAKNHIKLGLNKTKGLIVGGKSHLGYIIRFNHPPLLHLSLAGWLKITKINEVCARIFTIMWNLLGAVLIYLITYHFFKKHRFSLVSVFTYLFMPISIFSSLFVLFEPMTLTLSLLELWGYLNLLKKKNSSFYTVAFYCGGLTAILTDWQGFFLTSWLLIHSIFFEKKKIKYTIKLFVGSVILCLFYFYINYIQTGRVEILGRLQSRSLPTVEFGKLINRFLFRVNFSFGILFWISLVVFIMNIIKLTISNKTRKRFLLLSYLIILFIWPTFYTLIFLNGMYAHDFWLYYYLPFLSVSSAIVFESISKIFSYHRLLQTMLLVVLMLLISSLYYQNYNKYLFRRIDSKLESAKAAGEIIKKNNRGENNCLIANSPIAYYSDCLILNIPYGRINEKQIKAFKPKWVSFQTNKQKNLENFVNFLRENNYYQVYKKWPFQVWAKKRNP